MLKKVAIIIPFYQCNLSDYEIIALQQCKKILINYPKIAIKPVSLNLPELTDYISFDKIVNFENDYFENISGYNRLMLSADFYYKFLDYEYILIYQLDAFVFKDELNYWCNQNWDYIGAPWIRKEDDKSILKKLSFKIKSPLYTYFNVQRKNLPSDKQFINKVGNGGFSLRRVKKFYDTTLSMQSLISFYLSKNVFQYNEDSFWSIEVNRKKQILNIPSYKIGLKFSFEFYPERAYKLNQNTLPFGCHDWDNYISFWQPIFKQFHYNI